MEEFIRAVTVYALPVIFAITLHEAAHAYAAKYFGDNTAYAAGRMSLNPIRHIDLFGTILLPVLMYAFTPFIFGYAKPVPVDFSRLRNPKKQMAWVALAGPAANFVMAFGWMVFAILMLAFNVAEPYFQQVAQAGIFVNVLVFAFNLLPIPPLDGGRIVTSMLPMRQAHAFSRLENVGFFIVLALLATGLLTYWVQPVMGATAALLDVLATPFKFLLN